MDCPRCGRGWDPTLSRCAWCGALQRSAVCANHAETLTVHACAVCGTPLCTACDRGSRYASLCEGHREVRIVDGWAEAGRATDEPRAAVTAESLRASGFDVVVLSQKDHANVVAFGGLAVVRILVPACQWEEARDQLRRSGELEQGIG